MLQSPRWGLSSLAEETRRGGRASTSQDRLAGYLKLRHGRSRRDGLHARRDRSGDLEDIREARHPRTMHECMEPRVIADPRRPRSRRLLQFRKSACILRSGTVPAMSRMPTSRLHYSPAATETTKARQSRSARKCLAHRGDHLDQRHGGDRARGSSRGPPNTGSST